MRMREFIKIIIIYFCSLQYVHAHYNQDSSEEVVSQADSPINLIRAYAIAKNRSCENDTNANNSNAAKEQNSYASKIQENIGSRFKTAITSVKKILPKTGQENFVDMAQAYFHSNAQKSSDGGSETVGESSGQENNARWTQTQIDSRNQKSGGSGSEMVNKSGGQKNSASRTQTSSDSNDPNLKNGGVQGDSQSNKQEAKYTQYHDTQKGYDASAIGSENFQNQQGYVASVDVSKNDQNRYHYGGLVGSSENVQNQQGYAASVDVSKNDQNRYHYGGLVGSSENVQNQQGYAASVDRSKNGQIQYRYDHSASSSESGKNEYASIRNLQNQQVDVASIDGSKYDSADGSRYDQNWYWYNNSVNGSNYDQNRYRYNASANSLRYDQNRYQYNNSVNGSRYDQNWYRYNDSANGSRYDQNQSRYNTFVDGSRYDQGQYRYADSADGSGNDQTQYRYDASVDGSKYNQNQYRHDSAAVSRYDQNQNNYGSNKDQKQYLYATSATNTKAMYQCNSCPTLLSVVSGSETINQYPGTNQYNCSDITLRCANPNGGGVSFRFYYNGSLAVYDNKCGVDYETVMCSTEGYQWVTINNQYYKVDSVQCSYPNNTCNSTLTTQSPSTNSTLTTQSPATNTKAMYQCNSCPTLLSVISGSETINQYPGTNQYNCSDITLRCANPSGGGVSFRFYYNGSLTVYDSKCGVDYETVMCSTEGYQWVTINNQYYKVDSVQCSYPNNTCNSTLTTQSPSTNSTLTKQSPANNSTLTTQSPATNTKAMYQCNSCPTLLSVVSGSETINQYPGTNQYNCSDVTLRCANPSGGGVSFQFYYNGSLAVYDNKCGVDYETVMCSTEGYQWVTINNQHYKVDSVQCSYPNNTCNSTLTTQSPATNTKAMYQCNSCPTLLSVVSGSEIINQYPGTNQYNCSDITLRCANPGGGVSFQFYYNGSLAVYDNKCGVDYETVMCSTEGYQWVTINNQYYKVDSVHCSYPSNTCNTTSNMQNPPTTAKDDSTKNENFDGEANSADQKSWKNSKKQKWTNGKNSMDLSNEENRFWAEVNNFENGESDNSINVKTWLRGKNTGWHKNHHKNIIPTDKGHFDEETNDTMVHVELREWYKNHFRDENSTGDDSFEKVRNSNDQRPWLRGDRREKERDFDNKLSRDRWDGNFEKDDNSTESEYWGRRNKSKTRKFAYLTQNIDSGNMDGQKLSAYENMYKNFVSDKRGEINIPLYYPDGKHLGQLVDTNSSDIGFDKKEYENSTWHQNSIHKNFSWFNSPPEKSINWTVSLSGGIKAKFWLNENNRSSHITGIKKPLVIVTVDHETNNQTNLTQADRLQIYRAWYRESINIINERESGSCQVSKYRDNMFCYPGPRLDTSNTSSSIIYCDDIQQKYENVVGEIDEFMKILSNTTDLVAYLKNTSISSIRNILQTEKEKISQMIVIMENTKAEADLNKKLCMVTELINILPEEGINASNYETVKVEIDNFANKYFKNWTVNLDDVVMQILG